MIDYSEGRFYFEQLEKRITENLNEFINKIQLHTDTESLKSKTYNFIMTSHESIIISVNDPIPPTKHSKS